MQVLAQTLEFIMIQEAQKQEMKTDKDKANEDFLKFISDSRDWAYTYIDEVQASLNKFITITRILYLTNYQAANFIIPT